ncbi:MAG: hypothetical protein KDB03_20035 [Planctomycetales bacterium]|nr:hypothetical protein [Planctomycetales bacterium]
MLRSVFKKVLLAVVAFAPIAVAEDLRTIDSSVQESSLINLLHQREWVRLDASGSIGGKLMVLAPNGESLSRTGSKVLLSLEGEVIASTETDSQGQFSFSGIKPGTYALQAVGNDAYAAFALHVMPSDETHLGSELDVYASSIGGDKVSQLLSENLVPADLDASHDAYYRNFADDPIANDRQFNGSSSVVLRAGNLVGRVSRPGWTFAEQDLTGSVAQILRDGEIVAKVAVGKDGYFVVENLEPGVYDLVVAGDDGFAVLSFEAIESQAAVASIKSAPRFVSTVTGLFHSDCLCCEMIQQPEVACCSEEVVVEEVVMSEPCGCGVDPCGCGMGAPVMGGGFAGPGGFYGGGFGGGGGGGFGGGFGGIGGALGAAGLAIGIAALADNNDGFNNNIATPVGP